MHRQVESYLRSAVNAWTLSNLSLLLALRCTWSVWDIISIHYTHSAYLARWVDLQVVDVSSRELSKFGWRCAIRDPGYLRVGDGYHSIYYYYWGVAGVAPSISRAFWLYISQKTVPMPLSHSKFKPGPSKPWEDGFRSLKYYELNEGKRLGISEVVVCSSSPPAAHCKIPAPISNSLANWCQHCALFTRNVNLYPPTGTGTSLLRVLD